MKTMATLVHDAILYSFDETSAYAFDVKRSGVFAESSATSSMTIIIGNRFYAFTADGLAYCLELHP